jgi:hypothetical protein
MVKFGAYLRRQVLFNGHCGHLFLPSRAQAFALPMDTERLILPCRSVQYVQCR